MVVCWAYFYNLHYEKFPDGTLKCIEDEIPFDLPNGWVWCRLSQTIMLYSGQDLIPSRYNDEGKGIPYITGASNLENKRVIINRWTETPTTHASKGDLLLTCKGSGVGKMAWCDIDDAHIARQIMALRCVKGLHPEYLELLMSAMITSIKEKANGLIPGLSRDVILDILSPIPPASEQERIVQGVTSIVLLIDQMDHSKAEFLDAIRCTKSRILDLAIRGRLVPQDPEDEPASVLLERIRAEKEEFIQQGKIKRDKKESVIFRGEDNSYYEKIGTSVRNIDTEIPFDLPTGWAWCRGHSCFSGMESTKPHGDFFDYIDIDAIDNQRHCIKEAKHLSILNAPSRASRAVNKGSVLFSLVRPYLENIALVDENHSQCIASSGFYVCNSNGTLLPEFLFFLMISGYVVNGLNEYMKGDNSPSISKENIENWLYPVPPKREQAAICTKLNTLFSLVENIEKSLS